MHHNICVGQDLAHPRRYRIGHLLRALESGIAFQSDGNIGEIAVAGFSEPDALHLQHAIDGSDAIQYLVAHAGRRRIEQRINCSAGQPPTHGNHHGRYKERGNRIGLAQPFHVVATARPNQRETDDHYAARPHVG